MNRQYIYAIIIVYLCTAFFSIGNLSPDEYAQILEFSAYKLHLSQPSHLPWEFYAQIRPTVQAFLVVYLYKFFQFFTTVNPFVVAFITRLFSAALSIYAAYLFIMRFQDELKTAILKKWMILLSFFSYLAVFNSVRYSCENISGKLFIVGLCLILSPTIRKHYRLYVHYLLCGVLLGFAFYIRFEIGLMVLGLMLWLLFIKRLTLKLWMTLSAGIILATAINVLIDHWFYGNWVFTAWNYFQSNILQNHAAAFGTSPWYAYAGIALYWPYGILYVACTVYFIVRFRKHVVTWILVPFLLVHIIVGHKEFRFITPLLPLMPFVIMASIQSWKKYLYKTRSARYWQWLVRIAWYTNCVALLCIMLMPAKNIVRTYNVIFNRYHTQPTLLYIMSNPQYYFLEMDFYNHTNVTYQHINNPAQIHCPKNHHCVLMLTCEQVKLYGADVYGTSLNTQCPKWIYKINFNNWLSRSSALENLYEIQTDSR